MVRIWCCVAMVVAFCALVTPTAVAAEENGTPMGKELYERHCASCHGITGDGRGYRLLSRDGKPAARDYTNGFYMNMVPDVRLFKVIKFGGKANNISKKMPPWEHVFSDHQIKSLIFYIRSFAQPPYEPEEG